MSYWNWIEEQRKREKADFSNYRRPQQQTDIVVVEAVTDEEVADFTANWLSLQLTMQRLEG